MAKTNWILDRLPNDVPLVVIFGEAHSVPSHILSQIALMRAFKEAGHSFSLGHESHSSVMQPFIKEYASGQKDFKRAQLSYQLYFEQIVTDNIPFKGNDIKSDPLLARDEPDVDYAKIRNGGYPLAMTVVDQTDRFTLEAIKKHAPELEGQRLLRSARYLNGRGQQIDNNVLALSNAAMVDAAAKHISETGHKLYLQHCGLTHLLGDRNYVRQLPEHPYKDSLCAKFLAKEFAVLNIAPSFVAFPHAAQPVMDRTITPYGMNESGPLVERALIRTIGENSNLDFDI